MNWHQVEGNWKQFKGKVREHWGKFTDDELDVFHGKREQFVGKLQEKYGIHRETAEEELDEFLRKLH
jgi:uncharacterized protein YjbJ (UPF0337 family)